MNAAELAHLHSSDDHCALVTHQLLLQHLSQSGYLRCQLAALAQERAQES